MSNPIILFLDQLASTFGPLPWVPEPDGQIHRFHVPGDRTGSRNGWYVLHLNGIAYGAYGNWKAGSSYRWSSRRPNRLEASKLAWQLEQAKRQQERERCRRQQSAEGMAIAQWRAAAPADANHPYLLRKSCQPYGLRQRDSKLLVPLYDGSQLVNLQLIGAQGEKRFLPGGRIRGCYATLGHIVPGCQLYVCEGWATGASLHEATGAPVAIAMSAGNLKPVAQELSTRYGSLVTLIIAGDDDRQTPGNPGRTAAIAAGLATNSRVMFPTWPDDAPPSLTDFNDLVCWSAAHE